MKSGYENTTFKPEKEILKKIAKNGMYHLKPFHLEKQLLWVC